MMFKIILLFCIVYAVAGKHVKVGTLPKSAHLNWTTNYYVEARKYYMASSLIEHFKYWRLDSKSRLEANDGAVIKIAIDTKLGKEQYEIHPETTEEDINKMVCVKEIPNFVMLDNLLPFPEDFSEQGTDNVKGIDCVKFTNEDKRNEMTLWAYYDNSTELWIPVRYKAREIDNWHGYLKNHEIWDYYNFKPGVSPNIFNVTYNCTTKERYNRSTEKISSTNHLFSSNTVEKKVLKDRFSMGDKFTKYGGLRREEPWRAKNIPFPYSKTQVKEIAAILPKEYDLRLEGLVGPVINRQDCESAWAFAVTAAIEGALARSNGGTWIKLSEQALIDCSWGYGNKGCETGHPTQSYEWIMEHGLPTEQKYGTYKNKNGFCNIENMKKTFKIKGYTYVTPFSVEALKIALINHGPIVVQVDFKLTNDYNGGVYYRSNYCNSTSDLTDIMALVGYGEKDGETFWILKDSRGPYSGIVGYIHVSARDNNCGVMTEPTYVVA